MERRLFLKGSFKNSLHSRKRSIAAELCAENRTYAGSFGFHASFFGKTACRVSFESSKGLEKSQGLCFFEMLKRIRKEKKAERFQKTVPTLFGQQSGE